MDNAEILGMLNGIILDKGIPRNIKPTLEKSLIVLKERCSIEEKISSIISLLDDVSNDPNMSAYARTQIWSVMTALEGLQR